MISSRISLVIFFLAIGPGNWTGVLAADAQQKPLPVALFDG